MDPRSHKNTFPRQRQRRTRTKLSSISLLFSLSIASLLAAPEKLTFPTHHHLLKKPIFISPTSIEWPNTQKKTKA